MSKHVLTDAPLAPGYLEPGGAYLLTWNPANRTLSKQQFQKIRKAAALGENPTTDWSMGGTGTVKVGAPFLFVEQGAGERGLIGWGRIRSSVYRTKNYRNQVIISFDAFHKPGDRLRISCEELNADPRTSAGNWGARSSGTRLKPAVVEGVRDILAKRGLRLPSFRNPKPVTEILGRSFTEGGKRSVLVTRHERSRDAREDCTKFFGCVCQGCGFDFRKFYGPLAGGMIEVHHLYPVSQAGKRHKVDPTTDLIPLCANCHRVVHIGCRKPHQQVDPLTILKLRNLIKKHGRWSRTEY